MEALTFQVSTVLGDSKPSSRWYGDGSADCPYCTTAIRSEDMLNGETSCRNPWCDANPAWRGQEIKLQARRNKLAEQAREEASRKRNHELTLERIREDNRRRAQVAAEQWEDCAKRKACLVCSKPGSYYYKPIKHRKECPKVKR